MIVTLLSKEKITSITLPPKKEGQYWLKDIISIEGIEDEWILKSNRKYSIINYAEDGKILRNIALQPIQIYHIRKEDTGEELAIFTEPITNDRQEYKKLTMRRDTEVIIGRSSSNDIIYKNTFASSKHARMIYNDTSKTFYIEDLGSSNGTFVNRERIDNAELELGDIIYIMGFKIIIGTDFIAYNNPDNAVSFNSENFLEFKMPEKIDYDDDYYDDDYIEEDFFIRSPRFKRDIETASFNLASPPAAQNPDDTPAILTFGPSITMGMGSMVSAVTSIATFQIPAAITSLGMLASSLGFPTATKKYQKKLLKKREIEREEKFTEYMEEVKEQIEEEIARQKEILEENFITIDECAKRIYNVDRSLWDHTIDQNDFLKLRVGIGNTSLNANINYQKKEFELNKDKLDEQMRLLAESPKIIENVPIIVSFKDAYMSGVIGDREKVVAFAKGLILQMATYYGYDEVKFVFIYDEEEENEFEFVKWLPHSWSNDKTERYIATNETEVKEVSTYLDKEINRRKDRSEDSLNDEIPYYIVFALSKDLSLKSDLLKRLTSIKKNINMSLITFFDELRYIPKECSTVIEVDEESKIYNKYDITGKSIPFNPDILIYDDLDSVSVKLANIKLDLNAAGETYHLPTLLTFLEMYNVGKVEHLNSFTRWKENDPTRSLKAPIGLNINGNLFYMDLHEKFQGPHGLIAGSTGSGKSEFIITYILSLAVNYHPDEIAFILIDYKGGGMAKALNKLPHVAGIITNLDGAEVNRALMSIESELMRRQNIFNKTREELRISNIDIYSYQKLYRDKKVKEPLQHLFIISDEFAELKSQQPEFMNQLISTARIGRSLGVHLILATQKPSGVVDDQIWSNARAKVCLKVQDRSDSMDMLKREEAAEIKETGRFYLQVGYNESFELGQSAWAGANYIPQDKVLTQKDTSIKIIDRIGQVLKEGKIDNNIQAAKDDKKQLDAVLEYLINLANDLNVKVKSLWLPPIPKDIYLEDIENNYEITHDEFNILPLIGLYDDPKNQRQVPLQLPISENGNISICGMPGSGMGMFLTTLVYSMVKEYSSEQIGLYILDFDAETLGAFKNAPQVGDVVFSTEKEKVVNLFKMLSKELDNRKKLLVDYGGEIDLYNKKLEKKLPKLYTIIHNYEMFRETYDNEEETLQILSREGNKYGISFILTASSSMGFGFKVLQNCKMQIALQQKDDMDYSSIVGQTEGLCPTRYVGRGLINLGSVYEFQIAHITDDDNELSYIREFVKTLEGENIKKIPILPEQVDKSIIKNYITEDLTKITIGVNTSKLDISMYDFKSSFINMIIREKSNTYIKFIKSLISIYKNNDNYKTYIFDCGKELEISDKATTKNECIELLKELELENRTRHNTIKNCEEEGNEIPNYDNIMIIINSLSSLKKTVDGDDLGEQCLQVLLDKGQEKYNINFIIIDDNKKIDTYKYDNWFKEKFNNSNAIWLGSSIDDYYLNLIMRTPPIIADYEEEYGYVITNGRIARIKLIQLEEE